jgi:hypothetical protein
VLKDGWYVLTNREGVAVTKGQVDRLIEEADLEDAGLTWDDSRRVNRRAGASVAGCRSGPCAERGRAISS